MGGGGGGNNGPSVQQQQLQTQQAVTTANLNLEENEQRKAMLNSMQGTRVFRGSALSRAVAGNTPGSAAATTGPAGAPSRAQINSYGQLITPQGGSLIDAVGSGATPAGGAGGSGGGGGGGGRIGGAARGGIGPQR